MRDVKMLFSVLGLCSAPGVAALAAEINIEPIKYNYTPAAPTWSVVGSLSPTFTDNALFSRDDRRKDGIFEPDVSVRLDGKLAPDLSYRIYARGQFDAFANERDGNAGIARLGARLTKNIDDWRITGTYENRYDFDGVFRELAFISHDLSGSVSRNFIYGNVTLSPLALLTYRFSDLAEARASYRGKARAAGRTRGEQAQLWQAVSPRGRGP